MCTVLHQPRAIVLSKSHKPSGLRHVLPRPRSRSPSASRSYVVFADPTTVFCNNRLASIRQTVQSDQAKLVRLHDTLQALKSSSANSNPSHDNLILADMTSRNAFKHPCCANKSFTLVHHNPSVGGDTPVEETVIKKILKRLPKLRVLAINSSLVKDASIGYPKTFSVPDSVGELKHLRYLAFRTDTECTVILPSSLNRLYQMQLLDFGRCRDLVFSCGDLINLRHVFSGSGSRISNISGLDSLQTIPEFEVSPFLEGQQAKQLRYLNRLSGKLIISGLGSVKSREEALEVDLTAKKRLTDLTLSFIGSSKVAAEVLEVLCPPVGIEKLEIRGYQGLVYPSWMVGRQNGGPEKLHKLELFSWSQPGSAPELKAFIHLHELDLIYCCWNGLPGNMEHLSSLKKLWIQACLNLRTLPTLPQSLEKFMLSDCNDGFTESCETDGHPNWQKLQHIPTKYFL
ncbi:hypothetical protein TRIUR3_09228 [Triticum urartu]|uniref:R13L1/DRL21-like LRR repeat region domain-containing protein n=2 Tax=Triticum urartu TaxID=4572 RepID=M8A5W9_TRIUA|nr:hypothetical protein TRIUR3_09228 [Triticum urartu]